MRLSKHPVASGIAEFLADSVDEAGLQKNMWELRDFKQFDAQGITAITKSKTSHITLVGGNLAFLEKQGFVIPPLNISQGMLFAYGIIDNGEKILCEVFELYDELKPYATVKRGSAFKSHILTKKSPKRKARLNSPHYVHDTNLDSVKSLLCMS